MRIQPFYHSGFGLITPQLASRHPLHHTTYNTTQHTASHHEFQHSNFQRQGERSAPPTWRRAGSQLTRGQARRVAPAKSKAERSAAPNPAHEQREEKYETDSTITIHTIQSTRSIHLIYSIYTPHKARSTPQTHTTHGIRHTRSWTAKDENTAHLKHKHDKARAATAL
jgi:hypothetical protein